MNRPIKFRLLFIHMDAKDFAFEEYDLDEIATGEWRNKSKMFQSVMWMLRPEKLQFTGLLDKNGVEIYEGDIVRESVSNYIIAFDAGHFTMKHTESSYNRLGIWNVNHICEVIGNIYENPELIKEK